ncbi:MAG: hypothetical protein EZS28_035470 [Streblomastix strix]|uniref:Uncharacterized protein n=1 Tax=Streblomastix strix TaxID=222440 RepID=A0A5J4UFQ1_9EUKA|nr:MAG: hypothetical protein EZS28_035470 [Streblomastix strix]
MVLSPPQKRSLRRKKIVRCAIQLMNVMISLLLLYPGQITKPVQAINITTQTAYTIVCFYYRQITYHDHNTQIQTYVAPERLDVLSQFLHRKILKHELITFENIQNEFIQQQNKERAEAVTKALRLGFPRIANEFRKETANPSNQYVRNFMKRYDVTFSSQYFQHDS